MAYAYKVASFYNKSFPLLIRYFQNYYASTRAPNGANDNVASLKHCLPPPRKLFLQQHYTLLLCLGSYLIRPNGRLYLADVRFAKEKHTDTGLTDTTAYGVRKLPV